MFQHFSTVLFLSFLLQSLDISEKALIIINVVGLLFLGLLFLLLLLLLWSSTASHTHKHRHVDLVHNTGPTEAQKWPQVWSTI